MATGSGLPRRRVLGAAVGGLAAATLGACANEPVRQRSPQARPPRPAPRPRPVPPPRLLPNGARTVFPGSRLIGWCGSPTSTALGRMTGDLDSAAQDMGAQIREYPADIAPMPVVELIATIANATPGPDGKYRGRASDDTVDEYLRRARASKGLLLLNIQPGRADFLSEVRAYERWLAEPDVGVALDPEWAMPPGETPGEQYGTTTGAELDSVAGYLANLVATNRLPQKVMVYHQVAPSVVTAERRLRAHRGVAPVKSVDGIGSEQLKLSTWRRLVRDKPAHVIPGFKLFYEEDTESGAPLMTPRQVLGLRPQPGYVMYE